MPLRHSGKAAIAFLLGALLWWPLNKLGNYVRWLSDEAAVDREVDKKRNPLEMLLHQAMRSQNTVSVSVKNGKVYIGRVTSTINPAFGMQAINLILRRSGHRDPSTQKMTLDVDYERTHAPIKADLEVKFVERLRVAMREHPKATERELVDMVSLRLGEEERILPYQIAIPIEEVQSVNIFDMDLYRRYFKEERQAEFIRPPEP